MLDIFFKNYYWCESFKATKKKQHVKYFLHIP